MPAHQPSLLERVDCAGVEPADRMTAAREVAARLTASIDVQAPPLLRAALLDYGDGHAQYLVLTMHHFAFDLVSMHTLIEDLEAAYLHARNGDVIRLPARTTTFAEWSRRLALHARSASMNEELDYWKARPWDRIRALPREAVDGGSPARPVAVTAKLDKSAVAALQKAQRRLGATIEDVLAAGLAEVLAHWTGSRTLWLDVMRHGRVDLFADLDLSRTVGWFSTETPVMLDLSDARTFVDSVACAGAQLRAVPNAGIGYGVLRYLGASPFMQSVPQPEIRLNHAGHVVRQGLFEALQDGFSAPDMKNDHLIEVRTSMADGCLWITWVHDGTAFRPATLQRLADDLARRLGELGASASAEARGEQRRTTDERAASASGDIDLSVRAGRNVTPGGVEYDVQNH
jgi:non-ribosomal peptide synthase protein (TIGR01720 family)